MKKLHLKKLSKIKSILEEFEQKLQVLKQEVEKIFEDENFQVLKKERQQLVEIEKLEELKTDLDTLHSLSNDVIGNLSSFEE